MSKLPTLRQFQDRFPTEEACLEHLMRTRYGERHDCENCQRSARFYRIKKRRSYGCEHCGHQVYPTAGTPFERTRTPLRDWFFVIFQFTTTRNGVAAKEVERQLGVTYKTAWRMCHMIRLYMGEVGTKGPLGGDGSIVEIDELIIGGQVLGQGRGRHVANKTLVMGMAERGGNVVTQIVPSLSRTDIWPVIQDKVAKGTTLSTDEMGAYRSISLKGYRHITVKHRAGQYVAPSGASVNSIEGFWSLLRRGIAGTHIYVSQKHLPKYLAEFSYRWNMRHQPGMMLYDLMTSFAQPGAGR